MAAAPAFTVIGKPVPRVEGPDKVTGRAKYSADYQPAGLLWAKNVRSPLPHARIVSINADRARAVPGVRAVLTGADVPPKRTGRTLKDVPIISDGFVRFVGDRVAVVAADTLEAAEEAAQLLDIEYEELPAIFDPVQAMREGAPVLHPEARSYQGFHEKVPESLVNACGHEEWNRGDVAQAFAEADVIVEHTFRTQLVHQSPIEPWACVVSIVPSEEGDRVEVWAAQKIPFTMRKEVARLLDLPESRVRINPVTEGADFGSKGNASDIVAAYYLAQATGQPVKLINSSHEDLIAASPRHPSVTTIRSGVKRDGRIVARETKIYYNRGAYGGHNPAANGLTGGATRTDGCYAVPNLHTEAFGVYTNQIPCGYMRAPGYPQIFFAVEAHMDLIARELDINPLELRLRNLPKKGAKGEEITSGRVLQAASDALTNAESKVLSAEKPTNANSAQHSALSTQHSLVGRGLAIASRGTGAGEGTAHITVNADGTITAQSSMPDNGTGGLTVMAQVVAESFGVPFERVRLERGGTDDAPIDVEAGGSKITNVAGNVAMAAANQVKEQLTPLAAQVLGAAEVEWTRAWELEGAPGGWRSPDGRFLSLEDLATEAITPGDPSAHATVTMQAPRTGDISFCVQAAEVEVDPETGAVHLRHLVTAQEVGTIINAMGHQGQIEGALVQGIGYALTEDLTVEEGYVTANHLGDYKLPTLADLPPLTTINLPVATGPGPWNARGIGELPTVPTAGAIANAVANAIGAPILELPITAERVLAAIDQKARS